MVVKEGSEGKVNLKFKLRRDRNLVMRRKSVRNTRSSKQETFCGGIWKQGSVL